jgi:hypothetical protein
MSRISNGIGSSMYQSGTQSKCKHIKREGESCRLNNNCTYPDCKIETFNTKEK